ncbi:hypothetical protein AGDE_07707 [Angomonas deanei]|uniref:Uncharacterized protein n=1 Tax=Angomonas deanei TaxID=59799 RepID=A0A7G2CBW3_9TRYP|nr:hypothetical protein AGDE_07707 [Angomonas deanei]CAD2217296.1 hypothetical protein, conserved [Angomonas deanei]|eukprot:EPY34929.1 hypothetical protein AGDE_07707 [Angomonas deanei]
METHIFCGPEFVLLIPSEAQDGVLDADTIREEFLLEIQTSLFPLCTPKTKRRLDMFPSLREMKEVVEFYETHNPVQLYKSLNHLQSTSPGSQGASSFRNYFTANNNQNNKNKKSNPQNSLAIVPSAPSTLRWLESKPKTSLTAEQTQSLALSLETALANEKEKQPNGELNTSIIPPKYVAALFFMTDTRMASEVYEVIIQSGSAAIRQGCLVVPYVRDSTRATRLTLSEIYQRRMKIKQCFNFDSALYEDLQAALKEGKQESQMLLQYDQHLRQMNQADSENKVRTLAEERQRVLRALLHYIETHVHYVGMRNNDGDASPCLIAVGLALHYRLTEEELLLYFVKHSQRTVRAVALFYLRHIFGVPEEYFLFLCPPSRMRSCCPFQRMAM